MVYSFANIITHQTSTHDYRTKKDRNPIADLFQRKKTTELRPLDKYHVPLYTIPTKPGYHNSLETDEDYSYFINMDKPTEPYISGEDNYVNDEDFTFTVTTPSRNPNLTSSEQAYDYLGYRGTHQPYYKWLYKLWIDEEAEKRRTAAAFSFPTPIFKKVMNDTPFPVPSFYIKHFLYFYNLDKAIKAQDERRAAASRNATTIS